MRKYESIIVFNPELNESALKEEIQKVENLLRNEYGSEIDSTANWGRKEIAYLVGRQKFGNFVCITFSTENNRAVEGLSRILSITDSVVKFHTSRLEERKRKFKGNPKRRSEGDEGGEASESSY